MPQEIGLQRPLRVADLIKYLNECPPDMPVCVSFYTCGATHRVPLTLERLEVTKDRHKNATPYVLIQVEDN